MRVINNGKSYIEQYDNDVEFLKEIGKSEFFEDYVNLHLKKFHINETYEVANKLLRYGWDAPLGNLKEDVSVALNHLTRGEKVCHKLVNAYVGSRPNVPAYCMNIPMQMYKSEKRITNQPIISIYFDVCCSCSLDNSDFERKCCQVLSKIILLEKRGYRVRLNVCYLTESSFTNLRRYLGFTIVLKSENQLINLKRLSFPLCNVGFSRGYGLGNINRVQSLHKEFGNITFGYGACIANDKYLIIEVINLLKRKGERCYYLSYYTDLDKVFNDL